MTNSSIQVDWRPLVDQLITQHRVNLWRRATASAATGREHTPETDRTEAGK